MTITVTIPGQPVPASVKRGRSGRVYRTAAYRSYKDVAIVYCQRARRCLPTLRSPVGYNLKIYASHFRSDGHDNLTKPIIDSAVKAGIIANDNLMNLRGGTWFAVRDRKNPRVEIEFYEIGRAGLE
jgi:Holliday junction resolvase RusA-like endonuclease